MADLSPSISEPVMGHTPARAGALKDLRTAGVWPLLALATCWLLLFQEVSAEWRLNPQYSYGYVVPFLALALLLRRWPERPVAVPACSLSVGFIAAVLLAALPAIRICLQANPEWRLLYWLHAGLALGLSVCFVYFVGGQSWVRFFVPPIFFLLLAVPWPTGMEQGMIQGLMRMTASLTVEVAEWFGIPAVQHGNVLETTAGLVGIDEACSGVRSLQSALMLSLFLGEMHRFTLSRRVALLCASLLFDLLANVARTTFLVWAAASRGLTQMEAWHDAAGLFVMLLVLPGLLGLALMLKRRDAPARARPVSPLSGLRVVPAWAGLSALLWIGLGEALSELWFRAHETKLMPTVHWSAAWPTQSTRFQTGAVPQIALSVLRCSSSSAASWQDGAGNQWSGFFLCWKPGRNSAQLAKGHRPEICLPAAGARLLQDYGQIAILVQDFEIPFRHQLFESGDSTVNVFYCLWPDRVALEEKPLLEDGSPWSRLEAVFAGKRNLGQQALELVLLGPESQQEAVRTLRNALPGLIQWTPNN